MLTKWLQHLCRRLTAHPPADAATRCGTCGGSLVTQPPTHCPACGARVGLHTVAGAYAGWLCSRCHASGGTAPTGGYVLPLRDTSDAELAAWIAAVERATELNCVNVYQHDGIVFVDLYPTHEDGAS